MFGIWCDVCSNKKHVNVHNVLVFKKKKIRKYTYDNCLRLNRLNSHAVCHIFYCSVYTIGRHIWIRQLYMWRLVLQLKSFVNFVLKSNCLKVFLKKIYTYSLNWLNKTSKSFKYERILVTYFGNHIHQNHRYTRCDRCKCQHHGSRFAHWGMYTRGIPVQQQQQEKINCLFSKLLLQW